MDLSLADAYDALGRDAPASQALAEAREIQNTYEFSERDKQRLIISDLPFPVAVAYDRCVGLYNDKHARSEELGNEIACCMERALHLLGLLGLAELDQGNGLNLTEAMKRDLRTSLDKGSLGARKRIWEIVSGTGDSDTASVGGELSRCFKSIGKNGRKDMQEIVSSRNDRAHGRESRTPRRADLEKQMRLLEALLEPISRGPLAGLMYFDQTFRSDLGKAEYLGAFIAGPSGGFNHKAWVPLSAVPSTTRLYLHYDDRSLILEPFLILRQCEHLSGPSVFMLDRVEGGELRYWPTRLCRDCGTPVGALSELGALRSLFTENE